MKTLKFLRCLLALAALSVMLHSARAANHTVTMANFSFTPSPLSIAVGDTVTWTNTALNNHTSTAGDPLCNSNNFSSTFWGSGNVAPNTTFSITFTNYAPGTNTYLCTIHCALHGMKGVLIITNGPNTPPAVTITNPIAGSVFAAPANVTIGASASDPGGSVTNVQFRVNSAVLLNDNTPPYSAVTNNMPSGSYSLTAIASDNLGATATNIISITVDAAPSVSITNPIAGAVLTAPTNVTIQASASDNGSVSSVLFLVDANTLSSDTTAPYAAITNNLSPGSHTLTAIATDNLGLKTTNAISIIVDTPPSVTVTSPTADTIFTAPANVTIQASASDPDAGGSVTNVQFLIGSTVLTNDTAAPFSTFTNNLAAGSYTLTAIAYDNNGVKNTNAISIIVNALPSISITNPAVGAQFLAPAIIILKADASDVDGTITNVQFFSGASSLGNVTNAPFNFTNSNLAAGNYTFTAKAQDNFGGATTSAAVNVFLLTNSTLVSPARLANGELVFTLSGIAGQTYITEGSTNLFDWIPIATNLAPANLFNITNSSATNFPQQFYRSRQDY